MSDRCRRQFAMNLPNPISAPLETDRSHRSARMDRTEATVSRRRNYGALLIALLSVGIGYGVGAARHGAVARNAHAGFGSSQTFSETGYARQMLEESSREFLVDWSVRYLRPTEDTEHSIASEKAIKADLLIEELRTGLCEFRGTRQEFILLRFLFHALEQHVDRDAWLDEYLSLLYEDPGNELVVSLSERALNIALAVNRESDLREGMDHWSAIPIGYTGKAANQPPTLPLPDDDGTEASASIPMDANMAHHRRKL
jgi:hypothetical protein